MKCDDYELYACRDKIFDRLCEIWTETKQSNDPDTKKAWENDIWRKANTLQAVALYWNTTADSTQRQKAMALMQDGYDFYSTNKQIDWWVDDFGWWGGFFGDLGDYTGAFPLPPPFDQNNLLSEMQYCYTRMMKNLDKDKGGIWNHIAADGEKNAVTNSWMLNLAAGLFNWTGGNADYRTMAEAQYKWLTTGQYATYSPPSWIFYAANGMLLWLPGITNPSQQYWSGDEGVFLRGLISYINGVVTDPQIKQELLLNSKKLISAAITTPNGFPDVQNVMHESPNPPDWSNDLATGKGVFMRLVTRFARRYNYFADSSFAETFKAFVDATAESVWCSCDKSRGTTAPNWNPGFGPPPESTQPTSGGLWPQVFQTDGLDALNAAVQIRTAA